MSLSVDIEKKLGAFHLRSQFEAPDETMALLGASGCGKSMTLKCIAGIVTPDRGRIVLGGRVLFDSEKKINLPPQQRRVGYLFQQYGLFPNMSVEQNILCGIRSGDKAEKRRVLAEKIRMFRLEGLEKKHPAQLSGGQQQRVALARILCSEPEAILLDVALPLAGMENTFTTIGIPDNAVTMSENGAMSCTVCRRILGVEENILLLRPEGSAEGAPMLRITVGHESDLQAGAAVRVALDYSKLLLL